MINQFIVLKYIYVYYLLKVIERFISFFVFYVLKIVIDYFFFIEYMMFFYIYLFNY